MSRTNTGFPMKRAATMCGGYVALILVVDPRPIDRLCGSSCRGREARRRRRRELRLRHLWPATCRARICSFTWNTKGWTHTRMRGGTRRLTSCSMRRSWARCWKTWPSRDRDVPGIGRRLRKRVKAAEVIERVKYVASHGFVVCRMGQGRRGPDGRGRDP